MEEKESKREKNSNHNRYAVEIVCLIIFLILLGGCAGWYGNELFSKSDKTVVKEKNEQDEKQDSQMIVYEGTDEKILSLLTNLYMPFHGCIENHEFIRDKKVVAQDISDSLAYEIAINRGGYYAKKLDSIALDDIEATIHKFLGKDYQFNPEAVSKEVNYRVACPGYDYDSSTKSFVKKREWDTDCGGTCDYAYAYDVIKAVEQNGILQLSLKFLFEGDNNTLYADYHRTVSVINPTVSGYERFTPFEKGTKYVFTFKVEDGNYVFVSSEPVA